MTSETPFQQAYSDELRSLLMLCEISGYTVVWEDPTWCVKGAEYSGVYMDVQNNVHGAALLSRHLEAKNGDTTKYSFGWQDQAAVYSRIFEAAPGATGAVYTTTITPPQKPPQKPPSRLMQFLLSKI